MLKFTSIFRFKNQSEYLRFQNKFKKARSIDQLISSCYEGAQLAICHPGSTMCLGMANFHAVITLYPPNTDIDDQIAMIIGHQYIMKDDIGHTLRMSNSYPSECRKGHTGFFNSLMINQSYIFYCEMYPDMLKKLDSCEEKKNELTRIAVKYQ